MTTTPNDPGGYGGGAGYGGAPSYGTPGGSGSAGNPLAIVSLITGILAILTCLLWFVSIPLGIAAVVTGVLARNKVKRGEAGQGGLARAGFITGIVGIVLALVVVVLAIVGVSLFGDQIEQVEACQTLPAEEQAACINDIEG